MIRSCAALLAVLGFTAIAHGAEPSDEDLAKFIKKGPLPPPRQGQVVAVPFPPPLAAGSRQTRPVVPHVPLAVVLHQPEGVEQTPPAISVTFNQAMVPVSSVGAVSGSVPVKIVPSIEGAWRWLGTNTISLVPKSRLRFATRYKVTVPAGTRSATGQALAKELLYGFDTPLPVATQVYPYDGASELGLDTPIVVVFNQAVTAEKLTKLVTLTDKAGHGVALKAVPRADWSKVPSLASYVSSSTPTFVAAFVPVSKLAPDTKYVFDLPAGVVSDEGVLPSKQKLTRKFSTYSPLRVRGLGCGGPPSGTTSATTCIVGQGLAVSFNHVPKDPKAERFVTVTPRPADLKTHVQYDSVHLEGTFLAETRYEVEVAPGVVDELGQRLAKRWSASITYQHKPMAIRALVDTFALLEKDGALQLPFRMVNVPKVSVTAYALPEDQLVSFASIAGSSRKDDMQSKRVELARYRVEQWQETPKLARDQDGVYSVSLKELVARHGPGSYALVFEEADRAILAQVTDLGLTARYDSEQIVVLATSIATGQPLPGVKVRILEQKGLEPTTATTDSDGVAVLKARKWDEQHRLSDLYVVGARGNDRSFLRVTSYGDDHRSVSLNWGGRERQPDRRTFLYPDRDLYRPGETVEVYGIDRQYRGGIDDRIGLHPDRNPVGWTVRSSRGRELGKGSAPRSTFGTFHFSVKLPSEIDLGDVQIQTELGSLSVRVQEYRAPEFEVSVQAVAKTLFFGESLHASVRGRYLFGAPMRDAPVSWRLFGETSRFQPAGHDEFHFGGAIDPRDDYEQHWRPHGPDVLGSGSTKLDASGKVDIDTQVASAGARLDPMALVFEAQVSDVSRQLVAGRRSLFAHASDRYIGVRQVQSMIEKGKPGSFELVVTDLDGKRLSGSTVTVSATSQPNYRYRGDGGEEDDDSATPSAGTPKPPVATNTCTVTTAANPQSCALQFPRGGLYLLEARSTDAMKRPIITRTYVAVLGKDSTIKTTNAGRVEVRLDRKVYQPGQTALATLRAPFADGLALVTTNRLGLLSHQTVKISGFVGTAKIAVSDQQVPGVDVSAVVIAARGKNHPPAAWAFGSAALAIARTNKNLTVVVKVRKDLARPGETVPVDVVVTDAQKRPVVAQVSLVGVDEAVLGMSGFQNPDPVAFFHYVRDPGVGLSVLLKLLLPEEAAGDKIKDGAEKRSMKAAESMAGEASPVQMASGPGGGASAGPTATRRLFITTPLAGVLKTDASGRATFSLPLPDNLTRFRLMAIAADMGDRFGHGDGAITVTRALQVRTSLPRFINMSDAFAAGVVVDNQTGSAGQAVVTVTVEGVELMAAAQKTIAIGAGEAQEVRFDVRAPRPGVAKLRFAVRLGKESDAVERTIPIWTPATTEAFATYGSTADAISQPIAFPADALPGFGGLSITLASTALTGLQDAARYLVEYPYGCAEQISSRAMPILVLGDIVAQFGLGGPDVLATQKRYAKVVVEKLVSGQRSDGSWGTWGNPSDEGRADLSAYILLVLRRGKEAGLDVPDEVVGRATEYLTQWVGEHLKADPKEPEWRAWWASDISAMALYAMSDWGQRDEALARRVYANDATLDTFGKAMLAVVFHRISSSSPQRTALLRELANRAIETPAGLHFQEKQSEALQLLMHSSARTDAIALLALLEADPKSELIDKAVRGLMDARINGRWDTTQANSFALYALARYFKVFEAAPTSFTASMWLGQGFLGESKFAERSMREERLDVPMKVVQAAHATDVTVAKQGSGRMYYRVGMRYALRDVKLGALDQGITVARSYETMEGAEDVVHESDGSWSVRAGAYVRIRLDVVVQDRRHYVVVDDPLPAGLELVNADLKTSARRVDSEQDRWQSSEWRFNHHELRDERSLHFADELESGRYSLTVVARATSLGTYIVPPTRSEEMYHPEVFGRSATDRLVVR